MTSKGYEEVHIPAVMSWTLEPGETLFPVSNLPKYAQVAFQGIYTLTRIQSRMVKVTLESDENILLCAPTGSGKTFIALLTILREIEKHIMPDGLVNINKFKIIYIVPVPLLVHQIASMFIKRLNSFGLSVADITSVSPLTYEQINEAQLIVCTPETWDLITRRNTGHQFIDFIRLVIIDDIHLFNDDRGPILEASIARMIRTNEITQDLVRFVGLCAPLTNYEDVATFLNVKREGLFYFDNRFRLTPIEQTCIGITDKNIMNDLLYEKVMEHIRQNQVLIYVHSNEETMKTARLIRDMCLEKDTIKMIVRESSASKEILRTEAEQMKNSQLKELFPYGLSVYHNGLNRADRSLVDDLFGEGHIRILISTVMLAWDAYPPARTVIIKDTQVYSPEKGHWTELGVSDVMQIFGRIGKPVYGVYDKRIVITSHDQLQYYLSIMNQQLPIESQMISKLTDHLNAEIVRGAVETIDEAVQWLSYTYLYVRMIKAPHLYSLSNESLIQSAVIELDKAGLIHYDQNTNSIQTTEFGRIASHHCCAHNTIAMYNQLLKSTLSEIDLFRIVSLSYEFHRITIRENEKIELQKLLEQVQVPVQENIDEPHAKINILLQAYISQLELENFTLTADMQYIRQHSSRLMRAIFEISLHQKWAQLAQKTLTISKMIDQRMWHSARSFQHFKGAK